MLDPTQTKWPQSPTHTQGVPKLIIQKSAVITYALEVSLIKYVSKVAPIPQVFVQTARWHSTSAELLRNPALHHGVTFRREALTVLFVVSQVAITHFRSVRIQDQVSQNMDRDFIFQQDGASPHFHREAIFYLSCTVFAWIGRGGSIAWPLRSPDLTPLHFSVWGHVEDKDFVPPLPASLKDLQARIT